MPKRAPTQRTIESDDDEQEQDPPSKEPVSREQYDRLKAEMDCMIETARKHSENAAVQPRNATQSGVLDISKWAAYLLCVQCKHYTCVAGGTVSR
jgi:hypothetical protein